MVNANIEKFSHDGRGLARIEGKTTFIDGALAGEEVTFNYTRRKKDFDEGRVVEVIKAVPYRVTPRCAHYGICGGCSLQHLAENKQIEEKEKQLLDLLRRTGHCEPEQILSPLRASSWHYRQKARLSVRYVAKKQSTLVGFREKNNPRYISEISECPILNRKVDQHLPNLRELVDALNAPNCIAQIEVAAGDEEVALIFRHLEALNDVQLSTLRQFSEKTGFILFLQPGGLETIKRFYPPAKDDFLHYTLPHEGLTFYFHPNDFTQVNAGLNRLMIEQAIHLMDLQEGDQVLDLFCGLGNFSLPLAKRVKRVVGVEGCEKMVERAKMNAERNGIQNTSFFCADLQKLDAFSLLTQSTFNKLLLDPPRTGAFEIVQDIEKIAPDRIVYVSCNPATLARDSNVLVNQKGYRFKAAGVMDMFPHTAHVESIALFERG